MLGEVGNTAAEICLINVSLVATPPSAINNGNKTLGLEQSNVIIPLMLKASTIRILKSEVKAKKGSLLETSNSVYITLCYLCSYGFTTDNGNVSLIFYIFIHVFNTTSYLDLHNYTFTIVD